MRRALTVDPVSHPIIQTRLIFVAGIFLALYVTAISMAPAVRYHTWDVSWNMRPWIGFAAWVCSSTILSRLLQWKIPEADPYLLPVVLILSGWGLLTIFRLSPEYGIRQSIWLIVSTAAFSVVILWKQILEYLVRFRYLNLLVVIILSTLTILPGFLSPSMEPRISFSFAGFTFQPSEPLKLLFIVFLAGYFTERARFTFRSIRFYLPALIVTITCAVILISQRDLGTAGLLLLLFTAMMYRTTGNTKILMGSVLILLLTLVAGYSLFEVVRIRVNAWFDPWQDPAGDSYQIVQSLIAIAAGKIPGSGPGLGSPGLVPVAVSDFIFTAIAEETGLIGSLSLVFLILLLVIRGMRVGAAAASRSQALLATGIALWFAIQSLLIIGGNIRLLPLTGVTLPFVSYGGSSLLTCWIAAALLVKVSGGETSINKYPDQQEEKAYQWTVRAVLIGYGLAFLLLGWWVVVRSDSLTARSDNLRRVLNDRYVQRGSLLTRGGERINSTTGTPGQYVRIYEVPSLSPVVGYAHETYGLSGLEEFYDPYLRGYKGYPAITVWASSLLSNQPPPGVNVRLTIDKAAQAMLDGALGGVRGAAVMLNSQNGEILAIGSYPSFDPSRLEEEWSAMVADPNSPFLNRAIFGQYPPGRVTGVFLLMETIEQNGPLPMGSLENVRSKGVNLTCAMPLNSSPISQPTAFNTIQLGCPAVSVSLGRELGLDAMVNLYDLLGWFGGTGYQPADTKAKVAISQNIRPLALGQEKVLITPLQMVLSASVITSRGILHPPKIGLSYQIPGQTWELLPSNPTALNEKRVVSAETADKMMEALSGQLPVYWFALGEGSNEQKEGVVWFIGGSTHRYTGLPITIAIAAEETDAGELRSIGESILSVWLSSPSLAQ